MCFFTRPDDRYTVIGATEQTTTYRCKACGGTFSVDDDSDAAFSPMRVHVCTTQQHQAAGEPVSAH